MLFGTETRNDLNVHRIRNGYAVQKKRFSTYKSSTFDKSFLDENKAPRTKS